MEKFSVSNQSSIKSVPSSLNLRKESLLRTLVIDFTCWSGESKSQGNCFSSYAFAVTSTAAIVRAKYSEFPFYIELSVQ